MSGDVTEDSVPCDGTFSAVGRAQAVAMSLNAAGEREPLAKLHLDSLE
jgi:hypothetical protein